MWARLNVIGDHLRGSYWFVPALMTAGAALLSVLTLWFDDWHANGGTAGWVEPVLYTGGPEGAREVLSTIAGSMITVAGVVFSITIVALTLASNQFGPRLLSSFMSDRGNQVTLGTFLAGFVYCLLVLRKTRSGDVEHVPHLSVAVALLLAVAGISVLIYYIHHVAARIQAPNLIASIAGELGRSGDRLFPHVPALDNGDAVREGELPADFEERGRPAPAPSSGFVTVVDLDRLLEVARDRDLVVRLDVRPGEFVVCGTGLATVWSPGPVADADLDRVASCVVTGGRRTALQDYLFPVSQLCEIATRSLSPGINDPSTATSCVQWLGAVIAELADEPLPPSYLVDGEGALRVAVASPVTFANLLDEAFVPVRQCADFHASVYVTLLDALRDIARSTTYPDRLVVVRRHAEAVWEAAETGVRQQADLVPVRVRRDALLA
jgi:uncharacterized membrane protein